MGTPLGIIGGGNSSGGAPANPFTELGITWNHGYWTSGPEFQALGLSDGAAVGTWPDEVSTKDATQGTAINKPTFLAVDTNIGSRPSVQFGLSGGTHWLASAAFASALTQPNEIVVIAYIRAAAGGWFDGSANSSNQRIWRNNPDYSLYAGTVISGTTVTTGKKYMRAIFNGASSRLWLSETSVLGPANAGSGSLDGVTIGAFRDGGGPSQANIVFVGVKNGALTSQNRIDLNAWSQSVYGTA